MFLIFNLYYNNFNNISKISVTEAGVSTAHVEKLVSSLKMTDS